MRLKPKTPMELHSAEQPEAVLADLEAKHGSSPTHGSAFHCTRYRCWRMPLKYMKAGESHQTANGFFTIKIRGYYCPNCGGGYGGQPNQ